MNRTCFAALVALVAARTAIASDFATEVVEATFKFSHPDSTSACFFVRRKEPDMAYYLISAAHTFERTKGETAVLVLREAKPDGAYERRDFSITIRHGENRLWVRHEKQDVAVLRISEPLPVAVAALPEAALADESSLAASAVHICSPLFVLTYPERFEANGAGFPVARQGIFASPPLLPAATHPTFLADFTTFAGDSGGPVFIPGADGHPIVVGIVVAQNHQDVRTESVYEERLTHYSLGLGTILHAQYVRDTIEAAAKQNEP